MASATKSEPAGVAALPPTPPVARLLGAQPLALNLEQGRLSVAYQATADFLNPAGTVQGGMLCAMLDDVTASLLDASLGGEGIVLTLNLNVAFHRPARPGALQAEACFVHRGRRLANLSATLSQDGRAVASATAVCQIGARPQGAAA